MNKNILNLEFQETIEDIDQCVITMDKGSLHQENCTIYYNKLSSTCLRQLELFSSKRTQTFQYPHCEELKEFQNNILYFILNTLQLIIFLSLSPQITFALALNNTERLIQETKIVSFFIILIVNLFFSITIFFGVIIICIFIAPFKIILGLQAAMNQKDFVIMKRVFSQQ